MLTPGPRAMRAARDDHVMHALRAGQLAIGHAMICLSDISRVKPNKTRFLSLGGRRVLF